MIGTILADPTEIFCGNAEQIYMLNENSSAGLGKEHQHMMTVTAEQVAIDIFEKKLAFLRLTAIAFAAGLGIFALAAYSGLIPWTRVQQIVREDILGLGPNYLSDNYVSIEQKVAETFKNQIISSSPHIKGILQNAVNFTYSGQFRLGPKPNLDASNQAYFYAAPSQTVVAYLSILHLGGGKPQKVTITVDNDQIPLYLSSEELTFHTMDLTKWVSEKKTIAPVSKDEVHFIQFSIDQNESPDNTVFINVLINVKGVEL